MDKHTKMILGIFCLFISFCSSCNSLYSHIPWLFGSRTEIKVLIPESYEGPVLIAWQIPDGMQSEIEDGIWIYRVQSDGALLLQNERPQSVISMSFWYVKADGSLQSIPQDTCFEDSPTQGVVVCTGMMGEIHNGRKLRPNQSFYVGFLMNERIEWKGEGFFELYNLYFDRLVLPDQK